MKQEEKEVEMKPEELKQIYKKYIDKPIYRVVPLRDFVKIKKQGINPKKDPYEKIKPKIKELSKIINKLEKKGFIEILTWGERKVSLSCAMSISLNDLKISLVDFAPLLKDVKYYLQLNGGALVSNIKRITNKLLENSLSLSKKETKLIKELNKWAEAKSCKNITLYVKGSCKCLETAKFQLIRRGEGRKRKYEKPGYLPSPFGSFEHFIRIIKKHGIKRYINRLKTGKYYLRIRDKISAKELTLR